MSPTNEIENINNSVNSTWNEFTWLNSKLQNIWASERQQMHIPCALEWDKSMWPIHIVTNIANVNDTFLYSSEEEKEEEDEKNTNTAFHPMTVEQIISFCTVRETTEIFFVQIHSR